MTNKKIYKAKNNVYIIYSEENNTFYEKINIFCNKCGYLLIDIEDEVVCSNCLTRLKRKK
jgi:hypothetical protein